MSKVKDTLINVSKLTQTETQICVSVFKHPHTKDQVVSMENNNKHGKTNINRAFIRGQKEKKIRSLSLR